MARPRKFDEQEVLEKAMQCFWEHGFEGTSVAALKEATGLNPFSLYNTFGDKRSLFFRALMERYGPATAGHASAVLALQADGALALDAFIDWAEGFATGEAFGRGCMMLNTVAESEPGDEAFALGAQEGTRLIVDALRAAVRRGQKQGTLDPALVPDDVANMLATWNHGLAIQAKFAPDRGCLRQSARQMRQLIDTMKR